VELSMSATHVTSLDELQAFVAEKSEKTGQSTLLVLVAILDVLRREQERCGDDLEHVARVGVVRRLVVGEMRRLWAERAATHSASIRVHERRDS
jgi:hypothetical protein